MDETRKDLIADWFSNCNNIEEVAQLYADLLHEIKLELSTMIDVFME